MELSKDKLNAKTLSVAQIAKKHKVSVDAIKRQLMKGAKVESEHTKDSKMAKEIARDHLGERPDYYEKLDKMEKSKVDKNLEEAIKGKLKKAVATGMTLANMATLSQVAGDAAEGRGSVKRDVVAAASALPGAVGWGATGVHYAKKAYDMAKKNNYIKEKEDPCWKGYQQVGMKKKNGKEVPNCVPLKETEEEMQEDWQKVNRNDKTDGLSQKAVNAYKRENPGSKLQTAVTEKNPTGKRASRRKSFCSRMGGMKKRLTSAKTANDPDSRINKALRRWNCEESVMNEVKAETLGSYIKKASASRKKSLEGPKPDIKTWSKRQKGITTAIAKLTKEETTMDTKDLINEAIDNIVNENLNEMKDNFLAVINEKVMEKLEERKKEIASRYFAQ